MKMRDVTEVALKVLGVYFIVDAALVTPTLVSLSYTINSQPGAGMPEGQRQRVAQLQHAQMASLLVRFAIYLVGGIVLLWCARRIAGRLVSDDARIESPELDPKFASPDGFMFCLKLIGVYALFHAADLLAQGATRTQWEVAMQMQNPSASSSFLLPFLPGALVLALAIYLMRGGEWLVQFAWPQWDDGEEDDER